MCIADVVGVVFWKWSIKIDSGDARMRAVYRNNVHIIFTQKNQLVIPGPLATANSIVCGILYPPLQMDLDYITLLTE